MLHTQNLALSHPFFLFYSMIYTTRAARYFGMPEFWETLGELLLKRVVNEFNQPIFRVKFSDIQYTA